MQNKDLFFLPDISGFSKFVTETEVSHSKHIIKELIELIISHSLKQLQLSEIEGDAVFFYAKKGTIDFDALYKNIEDTYIQFHDHLKLFESKRICPCGACSTASKLDLKFIVLWGELSMIEVQGKEKPYGKDVILAHRLLKNTIPENHYILVHGLNVESINKLSSTYDFEVNWKELSDVFDDSNVSYHYVDLSYLNSKIRTYKKESLKPPKIKPIIGKKLINIDMYKLYELVSNLNYRALWNKDADAFEFNEQRLNRVGDTHICVIKNDRIDFKTIHAEFGENKLVYGELTRNAPIIEELYNFITLEDINGKTEVTFIVYIITNSFFKKLLSPMIKARFKKNVRVLLEELNDLAVEKNDENISFEEL